MCVHFHSQLKNIKGFNGTDTLYYPVLYVNEVSEWELSKRHFCDRHFLFVSHQHAEIDRDFKQYLEDHGLSEVFLFQKLVPAILGASGESHDSRKEIM